MAGALNQVKLSSQLYAESRAVEQPSCRLCGSKPARELLRRSARSSRSRESSCVAQARGQHVGPAGAAAAAAEPALLEQPAVAGTPADDRLFVQRLKHMSYNGQYDELFARPIDAKKPVPKPSQEALTGWQKVPKPCKEMQREEPAGKKVLLSDVVATGKRNLFRKRSWEKTDITYIAFMTVIHGLCLAAPFTFSWPMVWLFMGTYLVTGCLGITLSFHRQLSHRSFTTPKWVEYALAYCGVLAVQGDPLEWVSSHRYHHLHTDTPLDPHSPYEGFWWSHMGWLLDNKATLDRVGLRGNTTDLSCQPFYKFIEKTYAWHVVGMFALLYAFGGFPAMVWGGALRVAWVYHITWFVNSASHVWGYQSYNTGDLSRNNWWVALLAFGEGWHNNHHAFEFSARHGVEWWQIDMTWLTVCALEKLGLADNIKLPSEKQKQKLAFK